MKEKKIKKLIIIKKKKEKKKLNYLYTIIFRNLYTCTKQKQLIIDNKQINNNNK